MHCQYCRPCLGLASRSHSSNTVELVLFTRAGGFVEVCLCLRMRACARVLECVCVCVYGHLGIGMCSRVHACLCVSGRLKEPMEK